MDNEDKALVQSLNALVNAMSEKDPKMVIARVQMLEGRVDDLENRARESVNAIVDAISAITILGMRQENAIKHLIWNKPEQALAALRGELKDAPNVNTDPI